MAAALIGVSFGGEACSVKLGREGKKSLEGSVAMFVVCTLVGMLVFAEVHLREYAVVVSALVATLTELYEPFHLNDNLTIPLFSSLALAWGFARTVRCMD
uniref:Dolichol kinase n=1 Tax=Octactis speculum TaxID=3111310 RepID=A0A7S2G5Z1_9STRA|mmetsp:Transcript_38951/g.52828  ORF Transcript_38951/g.52828 Transcript_38951/m.52828 type:complete len:100 (+) Transcript_38951:719-1018(+)